MCVLGRILSCLSRVWSNLIVKFYFCFLFFCWIFDICIVSFNCSIIFFDLTYSLNSKSFFVVFERNSSTFFMKLCNFKWVKCFFSFRHVSGTYGEIAVLLPSFFYCLWWLRNKFLKLNSVISDYEFYSKRCSCLIKRSCVEFEFETIELM